MARPKSFDEEAVLDQAVQLFWERGYEGTSLADLEAHLGLGRQSLYNSFGDKHALFLKALERYRQNVGGGAFAQLSAPGAGLQAIRGFFDFVLQSLSSPLGRRGCLMTNAITERGSEDADVLLRCNHNRDELERAFRRALSQARKQGEVPKRLDVEAAATLLVIQHYGLTVLAKTGATAAQLRAAVEALFASLK
jgi:TetR/AcrR family transcriptional regulator, transcriptional repressor for nem operon